MLMWWTAEISCSCSSAGASACELSAVGFGNQRPVRQRRRIKDLVVNRVGDFGLRARIFALS